MCLSACVLMLMRCCVQFCVCSVGSVDSVARSAHHQRTDQRRETHQQQRDETPPTQGKSTWRKKTNNTYVYILVLSQIKSRLITSKIPLFT